MTQDHSHNMSLNSIDKDSLSEVSASISAASLQDATRVGTGNIQEPERRSIRMKKPDALSPSNPRAFKEFDQQLASHVQGLADQEIKEAAEEEGKFERPAWSELKTKAGKERKRLPLACIACRRKKIRCSGEKPACKHCLRSRIPCVYKVTTRKPAPRTDYMTMLDKRLKRMEERVIKIMPDHDVNKLSAIGRASVKPSMQQTSKAAITKKRVAEEAFGGDLNEWANGTSSGRFAGQFPGIESSENRLLSEGSQNLPSREIQEHLSEVFFDFLYGQSYHVLHKPSFMRKLR